MSNTINAELATELTVAWLSNPSTRAGAEDVKTFLASMNKAVGELASPALPAIETGARTYEPAVSARKSLANPDFIVSMIDGKNYKTLKRHLSRHGLTPDEYRERFGLKPSYPMVAPAYSDARKAMAKTLGLGRKPGQKVGAKQPVEGTGGAVESKVGTKRGKSVAEARAAAKAHLGEKGE
ncbi:MucR family transcriptional regulator [Sphingomonas floccifaciens]|jgi:predicted transcriptional regulator|uniref:MucR family transcriptional regulator n=1 Tax=Sphingomonas floccifaciens TaxID=1844115 RepID=A0ABW4NAD0_9SPHN